jgi:hypothetical protein
MNGAPTFFYRYRLKKTIMQPFSIACHTQSKNQHYRGNGDYNTGIPLTDLFSTYGLHYQLGSQLLQVVFHIQDKILHLQGAEDHNTGTLLR